MFVSSQYRLQLWIESQRSQKNQSIGSMSLRDYNPDTVLYIRLELDTWFGEGNSTASSIPSSFPDSSDPPTAPDAFHNNPGNPGDSLGPGIHQLPQWSPNWLGDLSNYSDASHQSPGLRAAAGENFVPANLQHLDRCHADSSFDVLLGRVVTIGSVVSQYIFHRIDNRPLTKPKMRLIDITAD